MKEVRKKSADAAVNKMLVKAFKGQRELVWDRADAMQPQCGFGRMGICCTDCYEGPCRVNPFAKSEQQTICGRSQKELVAGHFLKKVADGTTALVRLAVEFGGEIDRKVLTVGLTADNMLVPADYDARLTELGQAAVEALSAISVVKTKVYGESQPAATTANLGALKAGAANIVLHGHVPPQVVKALADAAAESKDAINIVALCGSELSGSLNLPVLTNSTSQEAPLLTGAVDLLVLGSQCIMPAVVKLAGELGVTVVNAVAISDAKTTVEMASTAFNRRAGRNVDIPACQAEVAAGYTFEDSSLAAALAKGYAQGALRGLVYVGGCGSVANTQDAQFVKLANDLLSDGYVLVTAGCAGTALAKAGLCAQGYAGAEEIAKVLPAGVPAVLHFGSCHDVGLFLEMAVAAANSGVPVFAVLPEIAHNKVLATAIGFAAKGITTFISVGETAVLADITFNGRILPLADFKQLPQVMAEVAAAK